MTSRSLAIIGLLTTLTACEPAAEELPAGLGSCEDGTDLAWSDVQPILQQHCTSCHSSELPEGDRSGAPLFVNLDEEATVVPQGFLVWSTIWNGSMPKNGPAMPDEDAWLVWEWLSCAVLE